MKILYTFGVIFSLIFLAPSLTFAQPQILTWPIICDKSVNTFKDLKEDNFRPWITGNMESGSIKMLVTIWTNDQGTIVITNTSKDSNNNSMSCLIMIADNDLQIFEKP